MSVGNKSGPLSDIKVIDVSTILAGPLAATLLGDFGADVLKLEHPSGDPIRSHGQTKSEVPLWWKFLGRNKRTITLDLSFPEGQNLFKRLAKDTDVVIENFRPGTLERWNLDYEVLSENNPGLVLVRVTGYGQTGPYSDRPCFGTLAEAISGFASINGQRDSPPTLPPFGLADSIAGIATALAAMYALHSRDRTGVGEIVDLAIIEPILTVLGSIFIKYDQLGLVQGRIGSLSLENAPRNIYKTGDGKWIAISASTQSMAERVMRLVDAPEFSEQPWFGSAGERAKHSDELDGHIARWIVKHSLDDVVKSFEEAGCPIAPVNNIEDVFDDQRYRTLDSIISVEDEELGSIRMQNVMFRLLNNPGEIRWAGRKLGADNEEIYKLELGLTDRDIEDLMGKGII